MSLEAHFFAFAEIVCFFTFMYEMCINLREKKYLKKRKKPSLCDITINFQYKSNLVVTSSRLILSATYKKNPKIVFPLVICERCE